jgi:hypothetical protein
VAITGAHLLIYTPHAEQVRATLRDVFDWPHVDAGDGWLLFRLPPAEVGVHPAEATRHDLTLMCDDLTGTLETLRERGLAVGATRQFGWGAGADVTLAPGLEILVYQPAHPVSVESG